MTDYGSMEPYDHSKAQAGMKACFEAMDSLELTLPERFYASRWVFIAYAARLGLNFEKLSEKLREESAEMAETVARTAENASEK